MHIVELSTLSIIDLTTLTDKITVQSVVFKNTYLKIKISKSKVFMHLGRLK